MLSEIIKSEKEKQLEFNLKRIENHVAEYHKMVELKKQLDSLSDGYLVLKIKFAEPTEENINKGYLPCLEVVNIMGCVNIKGTINELNVSGLGIFPLMGEKHTVESFFRKISVYLK